MREYLFVCGCARSGTTLLAKILSAHYKIAIGIERFNCLAEPSNFSLSQTLFNKNRFFSIEEDDTHYSSLYEGFRARHYRSYYERYDDCVYVGDKIPSLYKCYDQVMSEFRNVRVVFIYRNIYEVASSYNARVREGKGWGGKRDALRAVADWNESLELTLTALKNYGDAIIPVSYTNILAVNAPKTLFELLELNTDEVNMDAILKLRVTDKKLKSERQLNLSEEEKLYIERKADFSRLAEIRNHDYLRNI